ncbi:MAG: hypothetical protein R3C11_23545 [Planctomycetaceae bacterium]
MPDSSTAILIRQLILEVSMEWFWINAVKLTFNGGVVEDIILGRTR